MKKSLLLVIVISSLTFVKTYAQIDPNFFNLNFINPAFVGSKDKFSVSVERNLSSVKLNEFNFNAREGSPKIFVINVYTPINENFAAGIYFGNTVIGALKTYTLNADVSYKIDLPDDSKLSFGIMGGFTTAKVDLSQFTSSQDPTIDLFPDVSDTNMNLGVGVYYVNNNFSAGLSVPNFPLRKNESDDSIITSKPTIRYVISSLYKFDLADDIEFIPAGIIFLSPKIFSSYYLAANFNFKKVLGVGINYSQNNFGILLSSPKIAKIFRVGFRIEFPGNTFDGNNTRYQNVELFGNADFNPLFN